MMEEKRMRLYEAINKFGLDYDKVINLDKDLHIDICVNQRRENA